MTTITIDPPSITTRRGDAGAKQQRPRAIRGGEMILLIVTMGWLLATVAGFLWGPFKYEIGNRGQLYVYLAAVHVAFLLGFMRGMSSGLRPYSIRIRPQQIVRFCVIVSAAYSLVTLPLSPAGFVGALRDALRDPLLARDLFMTSLAGWRDYVGIFVAPFSAAVLPLGIFYWRFVRWPDRLWVILFAGFTVFRSVAGASRHGLWSMMIIVAAAVLAARAAHVLAIRRVTLLAGAFVVTAGFTVYANFIATERVPQGARAEYAWLLNEDWVDENNAIFKAAPPRLRGAVLQGVVYFSAGYRGLAAALEQPFRGVTFGVGNSMFLTRNTARLLNSDSVYRFSLPYRLVRECGFSESWWVTAYPWFASDVTFPGSVLLIMVIAYALVVSYRDAVFTENPFAVFAFVWLLWTVMSFPQGSSTQDGSGVVVLCSAIAFWLVSRRRARRRTVILKDGDTLVRREAVS